MSWFPWKPQVSQGFPFVTALLISSSLAAPIPEFLIARPAVQQSHQQGFFDSLILIVATNRTTARVTNISNFLFSYKTSGSLILLPKSCMCLSPNEVSCSLLPSLILLLIFSASLEEISGDKEVFL